MFHFKDILNRVAHGTSPNSPARNTEPDAAEGFLCPSCMHAFTSQEELQIHYSASHKDIGPSSGSLTSNNEDLTVFQSFHQGVGDRYKQVTSSMVDEAKEVYDGSVNCHGENSSELTIKEVMQKLKDLIRQNELIAEEKRQVEQRAAALAENVVMWKATADEGESKMAALTNRLALVEAQLAHRENIDDAAVLRQELIQVQRVMDEMTRESEMESDQLKRDLQNLQQRYDLLQSECKSSKAIEEEKIKIETLEEALGKKEELVEKFSDEITMLKDTVSTLENELLQKCSVLKEKDCALENVRLQLEEIRSQEEEGKTRVAELEQNFADATLALKNHNKEHLHLKQLLESFSEKSKKDQAIISDLQSQLGSNASVISEKNKELMAINEKVEILTTQLKDYTISNEDLRCRNEEHVRLLEDKGKLITSLEDREKDIQATLQKNIAQMDLLNKNYLELMNLFQAQMQSNSKTDSDLEKKLLGQIECAVDILTKKSNQLDNLSVNDAQLLEKQMKDDREVRVEEMMQSLQSQYREKSDKLLEAERRIETLRSELEGRTVTEKAKEGEFEAIISSLRFNLQQTKDELSARIKAITGLEDALMAEKMQVSCKEEELNRVNTMYLFKLKELKEIYMVFAHLKKDLELCKKAVLNLVNEFKCTNQICRDKVVSISNLGEELEKDSKELVQVKQDFKITSQLLEEKKVEIEEQMKKLNGEQLRNSELQDINSIKSMEVEELMANLTIEKEKCGNLQCGMDKLLETNSQMKEDLNKSENKVRSLTADLLLCEKQKTDTELENKALEARLEVELHEKDMEIEELRKGKEMLIGELGEVKEKMKSFEIKYQNEMKEKDEEIEQLKSKLAKEEQLKEEMKNNLEEELLAKAALDRDYSQFKMKHESEVARLTENINSLTLELSVKEDSEKMKEKAIDKLQEQISVLKIEFEADKQALLERYIESTKESEHLQSTTNDLKRRLEDSQAALHEIGRENQTFQMELAKMYGRKWTEDADVTNCERCSKEFSLRVRKHHCRYCGKIFCNDCSSKMAAIASNKKPVRAMKSVGGCMNTLTAAHEEGT